MAYSVDFRKRAIEFINEGHTGKQLYASFKIYPLEVNKWKKLLERTGSLEPQYPKTRDGKIDPEKLKQELERKPDLTLPELAKIFSCTKQAVDVACKKLKITRKKDLYLRRKRWAKCYSLHHGARFIRRFRAILKLHFC